MSDIPKAELLRALARLEHKYILNEQHEPVIEPDLLKWGKWLEDRRNVVVAGHVVPDTDYLVSTIFTGMPSLFDPRLFETAVFVLDPDNEARSRFPNGLRTTEFKATKAATWEEALTQHEAAMEVCRTHPPEIDPPEPDAPEE